MEVVRVVKTNELWQSFRMVACTYHFEKVTITFKLTSLLSRKKEVMRDIGFSIRQHKQLNL